MLFYEGERFFFRGIEGSYKFYQRGQFKFSAIARLRFFDIPKEYQNEVQGDNVMWGAQVTYQPIGPSFLNFE